MITDRLVWFLAYYFNLDIMYIPQLYKKLKEIQTQNSRVLRVKEEIEKHKEIIFQMFIPYGKDGEKEVLRSIIEHRKELIIRTLFVSFNKNDNPEIKFFDNILLIMNKKKQTSGLLKDLII
ncbi:hypothetical protein [Clostridium beijerinckii]|uniref:hypothetical protein n=1 Tax=Clostridium beijerinckii TaxID=1520 RepID=UPI00047EAD35|nr:hypothetical protein [Clostridium beijerinckii]